MASSSGSAPPSGGNLTPNQAKPAKRSSSKLDILLMKLHNTADSSGTSLDPVVSRSGSSRRKPKVIRKVTESEENEDEDEYMDNGNGELNGKSSDSPDPGTMNGNSDGEENVMDSVTVDSEGNHVLPDGTMVVQPEPVLKGQFRGPEFSKSRNRNPKDLDKVMCTGCNKQLNPHVRNAVRRHPVLKVLICKKCYDWYTSDDIDQDSDGMDEQCRWCGEGGNLLCCDYCHNAFCKGCIKRNLGRAELSTVDDADEDAKWRCYVCNCKPLKKLVEHCNEVLKIIEEEHNKRGGQDCDSRSDKGKTKGKGKHGAQKSGSSTSVSCGKGPATPNAPAFHQSNTDFEFSADKTKPVLTRLTAVTTSFQMFLSSLDSDYKNHAKKQEIEVEVSKKLKRAMLSYKKLFAEIETFARGGSNQSKASPQTKRMNSQQGEAKQQHAKAASPSVKSSSSSSKDSKVKTDRLSLPKKTTEVIELSSENDSSEEQKPSTKKAADVKASSEKTGSSSEIVTEKGENGVSNVDEPKVEAEQSCKTEELIVPTESDIGKISDVVSETKEDLPEESINKDEGEETQMEVDSEEKTDPDAIREDPLKQNEEHAEEKEASTEADMEVTSGEPAEPMEDNQENNPDKSVEQDAETQKEVIGDDLPSADKDVEDYNQGDFISVYRAALDAEVNKDSQVDEDEAIEERVAEVEDDLDSEDDAPLVDRKKSKSAKKTKTLSKKGEKSKANDSDSDDEDDNKTSSARRKSNSQAGGSKKGPPRRPSNKRKGDGSSDSSSEESDHKDSDKHRKSPKAKAKKAANASDKEDRTSRLKLKEKKKKENVVNLDSDSEDERPPKKETTRKKKEHSVSDSDEEEPKKSQQNAKSKEVDEKPEEKVKVKKGESDSDDEPKEKERKSSRQKAKEAVMCISDSEEDAPTQKGKGTGKGKSSRKDDDSEGRKSPKGKGKGKSSVKKSLDFFDAEEKASPIKSSGRSREDIEAQRKLHQEMLVGDSSDSDNDEKSNSESDPLKDTSNSSSSEEEQGSDYDPTTERKEAKQDKKMSRTESAKKKTQDKFKALKEKREKEKKKLREKVKKERETRRKKRKDDSSDESDDDEPAKSKSKKKAQVAKSKAKKKTFFDDLDDSDTTKGKKSKKSKNAKDADSDSSDDGKKLAKKKKSKKEEKSDSSADSELDKDIAKLSASLKATTHKKTKKDGEVDKEEKKPAKKKKGKKTKDDDSDSSDDDKKPAKKKEGKKAKDADSDSSDADKKPTKKKEGKKAKDADSDSSDDDKKPTKKKKKQGSDVESEDDASKKKSSKGNKKNPEKDSSDDFDSDGKTDKKAAVKKDTKSSKEGKDTDNETDDKSKVKKEKKSKEKVEKEESDSSADSELDKDIAKLAALPLKMSTQKKTKKDGEVDKETKKKKKEAGPDKSPRLARKERAKKKGIDIDELSGSDSASDGKDEPDEVMEITLNSDEEEEQLMKLKAVAEKEEADKKARRALLASDSDSDLSANSSDDEDDDEGGKKKKKKKDKDDGTSDSSDLKTKLRKKQKTTALLNTKLSDSDDSDIDEKKKKKTNGKKKGSDDEFELEDDDEDEDLEAMEDEDDDDDDDKAVSIPSDSDESVGKKKKKKKKSKKDDSDEEIDSEDGKKKKSYEKGKGKRKRKRIKAQSDSSAETDDSDAPKPKKKKRKKKKGSDDEEEEEEGSDEDGATPGKKRKNIKKLIKDKKLSQDTKEAAKAEEERRKRITERQKLYNIVQEETETAGQKIMVTTKLVLESKKYEDEDGEEREKALIQVHSEIINKLKPHQVEAVKFLWGCLVESLERLKAEDGAGCILAHCMGLGKTLSMISFIHTLLNNSKRTKQTTCIVVCPLNTVLNWEHEFEKWVPEDAPLDVYELTTVKDNWGRADRLKQWHDGGGILIMGYEMYRNLSQAKRIRNKKQKKIFAETLVDPGPDLVVCDEGHILKNDKSSTSIAMNGVRTKRRVVLTGTPLQNNLGEYHCMVSFVKPSLLGTRKEFSNRFVNPITNGQCANASKWDVKLMKKRAHILHETLNGCVQRKDYAALTKFLPPKHEYILSIRLSKVQCDLYQKYLDNVGRSGVLEKGDVRGASLFSDYQNLSRIWTHPWILKLHEVREQNKRIYDDEDSFVDEDSDEMDSFIDDSDDNSDDSDAKWGKKKKKDKKKQDSEEKEVKEAEPKAGTSSGKRGSDHDSEFEIVKKYKTRSRRDRDAGEPESEPEPEKETPLSREWWSEYVSEGDQYKLELSGKLFILAEILKMSEAIGDKVLVFSQSLLSLDLIEDFLEHWDKTVPAENPEEQIAGQQSWSHGLDYFRMDGSTNSALRKRWSEIFNDAENPRARLFLISTKAGSLGTNMVGANRCIIFDASWNPTHDVQSIFRVYRFGQVKPVYIYRFLAQGTMEEKIYERQVTKQSLSSRVVDEHQIERHFTSESLQELYSFTPERLDDPNHTERPTPVLPKDRMLAEMITSLKTHIVGYHEHDSLLENQIDEELSEEDRKAAWEEYEAEKKGLIQRIAQPNYQQPRMQMNPYGYPMNQQPPQQMSMFPHLTEVARAIRNANPNVSMQELQQRLEHYMRLQMASQQQVLYQQQQQQMQRGVASLLSQAQVAGQQIPPGIRIIRAPAQVTGQQTAPGTRIIRYGAQQQMMQGAGAPEPGEVTFMGYGNDKGGANANADTGSALYSMLNGSKQPE